VTFAEEIREKIKAAQAAAASTRANFKKPDRRRAGTSQPIVYIPKGTMLVRFYIDSEGQYLRIVYRHGVGKDAVRCFPPQGCEICRTLQDLEENNPSLARDAFRKYGSELVAMTYALIFEYAGRDGKYIKLNTPVLLIGDHRLRAALDTAVSRMQDVDLQRMFSPRSEHYVWEITKDARLFSCKPSTERRRMRLLPDDLPPLRKRLHDEGEMPDPKKASEFVRGIREFCELRTSTLEPGLDERFTHSDENRTVIDLTESTDPIPPDCYGQYPAVPHAGCLICLYDEGCIKETGIDRSVI
jgi:hypothetical protein